MKKSIAILIASMSIALVFTTFKTSYAQDSHCRNFIKHGEFQNELWRNEWFTSGLQKKMFTVCRQAFLGKQVLQKIFQF